MSMPVSENVEAGMTLFKRAGPSLVSVRGLGRGFGAREGFSMSQQWRVLGACLVARGIV